MDYIGTLIKAHKALLKKVKNLQLDNIDSELMSLYKKVDQQKSEILFLRNKVADLELKLSTANRELEQRNSTILQLRNS